MTVLLSTKEVASFLKVNEKMVYTLVAEKGLPAVKITGKWSFPKHLVEQWIEANTINYPSSPFQTSDYNNLLIITGSNDPLLNLTIDLFNSRFQDHVAVFGNLGSLGGLKALRQNQCHIATSHLLQEDEEEYNFDYADHHLHNMPAIVNFSYREQGLLLTKGNPKNIKSVADVGKSGIHMVNRPLSTGTRLLFDHELKKAGVDTEQIEGYHREVPKHLDAGLEVLAGRADVAPGIKVVASLLDLDFLPLRWERFDLLIPKDRFFEKGVQLFLGLLLEKDFQNLFRSDFGYDLKMTGKIVFPKEFNSEKEEQSV